MLRRHGDVQGEGTWLEKSGGNMSGNEMKTMPKFESIDELIEFFETHDMGEY